MDWNKSGRLSKFKVLDGGDQTKQAARPASEMPTKVAAR
jgi:hypothetical protein